jgi:cryptochrome
VCPNLAKPIFFYKEVSLSPYFRYGCLSVRKFYFEITKLFFKVNFFFDFKQLIFYFLNFCKTFIKYFKGDKKTEHLPCEQLLWREFFYHLSYKNEKFDQIYGNIMSFKIPWDWGGDHLYKKWEDGNTGFPWIDACMRQLRQEGWIHHICRTSVSIFLTRGQFFLSWTKGHQTFLRLLVDVKIKKIFLHNYLINANNF